MHEWNRPGFRLSKGEIAMPVRDDAEDMSRDRWRRQLPEKSQIVGGLRCQSRARADTGAEPSIAATEGVYDVSLSILEWYPQSPPPMPVVTSTVAS